MKYVLVPLLACAALTACAPVADDTVASASSIDALESPAPDAAIAAAPAVQGDATMHRFAFEPRSEKAGPSDARIVGTQPSPCGTVLVARVGAIPLDDPQLRPDWIVESDAAGQTLRKWGVPYEALLVGIKGERVQFRTDTGTYWTDAAGEVEQADAKGIDAGGERPASMVDAGSKVECPGGLEGGSEGWQCAEVRDGDGGPRRLAVETVCS